MTETVLLLQGPVGPFFKRLAYDLRSAGHKTYKVNFNGGDRWYYPGPDTLNYTGSFDEWEDWLQHRVVELSISRIYLFGDCRQYHQTAIHLAQRNGIRIFVFECGYIRPDFITLEERGVNGFSSLSRSPKDYTDLIATPPRSNHALQGEFIRSGLHAMTYYLASAVWRLKFPQYQHHRPLDVLSEGVLWLKSAGSKLKSVVKDRKHQHLAESPKQPFFLVPLQVHNDSQVTEHSPFRDVSEFIQEVVESFAKYAEPNALLVFKHHPHDRAYRNYRLLITQLSKHWGLKGRMIYIHDLHLPSLLQNSSGTITINSTVGLSALHHNTPVITLGNAIYNMEGLCFQGSLHTFWQTPGKVNQDLFHRFRAYLLRHNQINGSLYQPLPYCDNKSGLRWPEHLRKEHLNNIETQAPSIDENCVTQPHPKAA